jgi:hypothetical protein
MIIIKGAVSRLSHLAEYDIKLNKQNAKMIIIKGTVSRLSHLAEYDIKLNKQNAKMIIIKGAVSRLFSPGRICKLPSVGHLFRKPVESAEFKFFTPAL